ncbi:hypothetical protein OROHE_016844 [Orobanche hederae]
MQSFTTLYLSSTSSTLILDDAKIPTMKEFTSEARLELDVSDDTAHTVVVMFDETAIELVRFSAESLLEGEDEVVEDRPKLP